MYYLPVRSTLNFFLFLSYFHQFEICVSNENKSEHKENLMVRDRSLEFKLTSRLIVMTLNTQQQFVCLMRDACERSISALVPRHG